MSTAIDIVNHNPHWAIGENPAVLTEIYDDAVNIALWQRTLNSDVQHYVDQLLEKKSLAIKLVASPKKLMEEVKTIFPATLSREGRDLSAEVFYEDIYLVLDMFACLFDVAEIGLRINTLERAMCPRFHKDNVAVRLVTTYAGPGTEWLSCAHAHTSKNVSILSQNNSSNTQTTAAGTIVLLKGENWEGNEGRGIIHRSPDVDSLQKRLLLTCDLL